MTTRWIRPPRLHSAAEGEQERQATWLELFFDLAFVASVAQLSNLIAAHPSAASFLDYGLLFAPVWFVWVGYVVYADRFDTDDVPYRVLVLAGVFLTAAVAVHIDDAFHGGSVPFVACLVLVRIVLLTLYARVLRAVPAAARFTGIYVRGWTVALLVWAGSLAVAVPGRYVLWGIAVLIEVGTPLLAERRMATLPLHVSHIGERFGLFTIIVLGESVVAVTAGIAEIDFGLDDTLIAVGAFTVAASLAWIYFDRLGTRTIGSTLYVYAHFAVFVGLGLVGPGTLLSIQSANASSLPAGARAALCGGTALYLLGLCLVAWPTRHSRAERRRLVARAAAAAGAVAIAVAGAGTPPVATVLALAAVVVADLVFELLHAGDPDDGPEASPLNIPDRAPVQATAGAWSQGAKRRER